MRRNRTRIDRLFSQLLSVGIRATPTLALLVGNARAQEAVPDGVAPSDWTSIRAAYEASRHAAFAVDGGYQARNPGQQWTTRFDGRGFQTQPDAGAWTWGLELVRYGFAGAEREVTKPEGVTTNGQRVAYDWDGTIEEWYVNDARGLEHGFTLRERPAAGDGCDGGALTLTLAVRGGLPPVVSDDGRSVSFTDGTGAVVLNYAGLMVFDADHRSIAAHFERVESKLVLSINERVARYPLTIDPIAQQAYLKASNSDAGDRFGHSIAVSGDTVVVGAPLESSAASGVNGNQADNSLWESGAAYVFTRSGTTWSQQAYLKASNPGGYSSSFPLVEADQFGCSVAVSGDVIVVGAINEGSSSSGVNGNQADNSLNQAGAAYVFTRSGSTWSQQAYLKASNPGIHHYFGGSVAVSGDTAVVGAIGDHNSGWYSGAAYVFTRSGSTWFQQGYLKASNPDPDDKFGYSVAVSGDTVVVGAWCEDSAASGVNGNQGNSTMCFDAGAAYVFIRNGSTWSEQAYLKASNTDYWDYFGYSVAVSGDTVVVGAINEDSAASGVNGDQADNELLQAGAAYVFTRNGSTWSQQAYLKASNPGGSWPWVSYPVGDNFGSSVAASGDVVVVGAIGEDSSSSGVNGNQASNNLFNSGAAYVFTRSGGTWSQQAYLKASNPGGSYSFDQTGDGFGGSVAVSGDTVVVGAKFEHSASSGVNGNQADNSASYAGASYVFDLAAWPNLGSGLAGLLGAPHLEGTGTLETGSAGALTLTNVAPSASAILLISLSSTAAPAYCGMVIPVPAIALLNFVTPAAGGGIPLLWPSWPAGLSGQSLYFQWLISDAAAPCTVAFSNAVRGDVP